MLSQKVCHILRSNPGTLKLLRVIALGLGNLPTNFYVSETFRSPVMGQLMSDMTLLP